VIVEKNETALVEGYAEIRVVEGKFEVFGVEAAEGFTAHVDPLKVAPFYSPEGGVLEVRNGRVSCTSGRTIPEDWGAAVEEILAGASRVLVLGSLDVGKSGFITYAANKLLKRGRRVGIIDADPGQSDVGPPTTIGLGFPSKPVIMLSEVNLYDGVFIGTTSPSGLLHRCVAAVSYLTQIGLSKADVVIVNTTGWVDGPEGRDLKISKTISFRPDLVIAIQSSGELEHLLKFMERAYEVVRLKSAQTRTRTREERRIIRAISYARHFAGAQDRKVNVKDLGVTYSFLWTGRRLGQEEIMNLQGLVGSEILWAEESVDSLVIITAYPPRPGCADRVKEAVGVKNVRVFDQGLLRHVLVGLGDREKMFKGLGIIKDVDLRNGQLTLYTKAEIDEDTFIQLGYIKVNPVTYEEEGWLPKWSL